MSTTLAPEAAAGAGHGSSGALGRIGSIAALELRKVVVTRGSAVLLAVTVGLGALIAIGALVVTAKVDSSLVGVSVPLVTLAVALAVGVPLIGVLIMTSDWQSREVMTLVLLEPRRSRIFFGKLLAALVLSLVLTVTVAVFSVAVTVVVGVVTGVPLSWTGAPSAFGLLVVVTVVGALSGSALAAVIMNTPLAVIAVILQPLVIDTALAFVPGVGPYLRAGALSDFLVGQGPLLPALSGLLLWIVVPLLVGHRRWARREVR